MNFVLKLTTVADRDRDRDKDIDRDRDVRDRERDRDRESVKGRVCHNRNSLHHIEIQVNIISSYRSVLLSKKKKKKRKEKKSNLRSFSSAFPYSQTICSVF